MEQNSISDCLVFFMDESGSGSNSDSKTNCWVSVGVLARLADHKALTEDLYEMRRRCMRLYNKEMKGVDLSPNHLNLGVTIDDVARDLAALIRKYGLTVIVTGANKSPMLDRQTKFVPSNEKKGLQAKDVARELMLERLSLRFDHDSTGSCQGLLVWDISDNNELIDFSKVVGSYVNPHNNKKPNERIIGHILGGLSHEWAEIQIADLVSNYALNYMADGIFEDANKEKSDAFKKHLYPALYHMYGRALGYGYKVMVFPRESA